MEKGRHFMNIDKLKQAEEEFFMRYPGGFAHPEMEAIRKKHKMEKMIALVQDSFIKENFKKPDRIITDMVKVVGRSSMVSVFEKPKFKDFVNQLTPRQQEQLAGGLRDFLYANEQQGFENMVTVLKLGKMAKWTLVTIIPAYFRPHVDVYIKPTTTKGVIAFFELEDLIYKPTPSWDFYKRYRDVINTMKTKVDSSLSPDNASFSGFMMMSI